MATAAPTPEPYGTNDAGGFLNILPPGQNGHADATQVIAFSALGSVFGSGNAPLPPHTRDQLGRYANLVYASPTLDPSRLTDFYKDEGFGVRSGDEESRYSPRDDVTIVRDKGFGVPHIYGKDRNGAMFGAGYAGAEDRLFLMDVLRHVGRAQTSSFIGGSEGNRQMDREQWQVAPYKEADLQQQYDLGDEVYGAAGEQLQDDVTNYVAGVNKYICEAAPARTAECAAKGISSVPTPGSKNGDTPVQKLPGAYAAITPNGESAAPLQPQLWRVTDVIATASLIGGIFGRGGGRELDSAQIVQEAQKRFADKGKAVWSDFRSAEDPEAPTTANGSFPYEVPPATPAPDSDAMPAPGTVKESDVVQPGGSGGGGSGGILPLQAGMSNALVVSGANSASGRPVAVFGPQTGYFSPQLLMELDMHAPATEKKQGIDARGSAFPGVNLYVQLGRGRSYAWSATSAGQDNTDTFALKLCNGGPDLADYNGYIYRGQCLPFERLERTNRWESNAADQTPPGSETLAINRTKLGLEIARAKLGDGTPVVYVRLRSTYMHEADSALGFVDYNDPTKMGSAADFQRAANKIGFTFNWFYANDHDTAYFNSGNNPVRPDGPDQSFPVRACPSDTDTSCKYEWVGWDPDSTPSSPNSFVAQYTPTSEHPQGVNQGYFTSWNNKQAKEYRAADDQFGYGPVYRSQPLDDRINTATASGGKITRSKLVDAMEDAATVDLRGDKVLPYALRVLGDQTRTDLARPVSQLKGWLAAGAHRVDKNHNGHYEHRDAIKIMDAWWPRWIEAEFKPELGNDLFSRLTGMIGLDDTPNGGGTHHGSAYQTGWYGYAQKDLRSILGDPVQGAYSRQYCGDSDNDGSSSVDSCRQVLASSLRAAVQAAANEGALYNDDTCNSDNDPDFKDPQLCFDAIKHIAVGAITQPLIAWQNRPTFQQVVEVGAK